MNLILEGGGYFPQMVFSILFSKDNNLMRSGDQVVKSKVSQMERLRYLKYLFTESTTIFPGGAFNPQMDPIIS